MVVLQIVAVADPPSFLFPNYAIPNTFPCRIVHVAVTKTCASGGATKDAMNRYGSVSDLPHPTQPFTLGVGENRRAPELNIQPIRISVKEFHESLSSSSSSSVVHVNGTTVI
jgi:hypothetical protein